MTRRPSSRVSLRGWRTWTGLGVSLALGAAASLVPALRMETDPREQLPAVGDRVQAAIDELRVDRVHVPDDGRDILDEAGEKRLETLVADSDPAVYVVVWEETDEAGYTSAYDAVDQIGATIDPSAVIVVWEGPGRGDADVYEGYLFADLQFEGEPETRITEFVEEIQGETIEPPDGEGTGDVIAGALLGLMGAAGAYGLLMLVVGFVRLALRRPFLVPGPTQGDP